MTMQLFPRFPRAAGRRWALATAFALALMPRAMAAGLADMDTHYAETPVLDTAAPGCCDTVFADAESPPWLDRVLTRLRRQKGPVLTLEQHVLFRHRGRPSYLVLIWDNGNGGPRQLQVYRVRVHSPGNVRLSGLFQMEDAFVQVVQPTGRWRDPTGAPLLVVWYGSGGSYLNGYGLRLFRLYGGVVEVTPRHVDRVVGVLAADARGRRDLVGADDRWSHFYHGCGSCGPVVPVILSPEGRGFRPACRSHPEAAQAYLDRHLVWMADDQPPFDFRYFEYAASRALSLAQFGRPGEGLAALEKLVRSARLLARTDAWAEPLVARWAEQTARYMVPVVRAAQQWRQVDCPLSAVGDPGAQPGFRARLDRFRP